MKKTLVFLLTMIILVGLSACNSWKKPEPTDAPDSTQTADTPPATETPILIMPPLYNATIEYGDPDLITDNTGPLWAYIRFPIAGSKTDAVIAEWAQNVYLSSRDEILEMQKGDPEADGEVNVQFDSYLVDGRYAGVLENGIFMSSHLAHPTSIVRTFNIDTETGTFLGNTEILDYSQLEKILSILTIGIAEGLPETVDTLGEPDEKWLEHIVIGHDGVIVVLERGVFLPSYLGAQKILLPYEQLGSAFLLRAAPEPSPQPPSPTPAEPSVAPPTVSPAPPPTESPSASPSESPPASPSESPSASPSESPSASPSASPSVSPSPPSPSPVPPPVIPNVPPQSGDIDPSKPMIALTFDDGPSRYTSQILTTLEKYGARATFCVVGNLVNARKDTVKRASDLGCEIIGHSWDHKNLTKLTADEIKKELNDTSAAIKSITGESPRLYRPPYGAVNSTLKSVSAELGYALICWSVDPLDWETRNAEKVYTAIMADTVNRAIVLSHDLYASTAEAMERVIPELINKGYQLVTVSELMYYSNITLEAGVVYHRGK